MGWEEQWRQEDNCYLPVLPRAQSWFSLHLTLHTPHKQSDLLHTFIYPILSWFPDLHLIQLSAIRLPKGMQTEAPVQEVIQLSAKAVAEIQVNSKGGLNKMGDMNMEMMITDSEWWWDNGKKQRCCLDFWCEQLNAQCSHETREAWRRIKFVEEVKT